MLWQASRIIICAAISHGLSTRAFFTEGGRIRGVPVTIGGSSYIPPLPNEYDVKDSIATIIAKETDAIDIAIELCLYCIKSRVFLDGNKRASVIFANHYLISHGRGFIVIPEKDVPDFKKLLVKYYEGEDISVIRDFMSRPRVPYDNACAETFFSTIKARNDRSPTLQNPITGASRDL